MNILRRGVLAAKAACKKRVAGVPVNRRIEVTVERETVTVLVRGHPKDNEEGLVSGQVGPESELLKLPPSALANDEEGENYP
jgi:hypothetical protein